MLASLFPTTIDQGGLVVVMIEFTAAILLVVGIGAGLFAYWSKREKEKRAKDVEAARERRR